MIECGVKPENIVETEVPGSYELPLACRYMAISGKVHRARASRHPRPMRLPLAPRALVDPHRRSFQVDAIIPIGILIKGDTYHFEAISDSVSSGLMTVGLQTGIPITFGVLTCMTEAQAKVRRVGRAGVVGAVRVSPARRAVATPGLESFARGSRRRGAQSGGCGRGRCEHAHTHRLTRAAS